MAAPTFADGQAMSASVHLRGLQREVQQIHDRFLGVQMPFTGWAGYDVPYTAVIRHKVDTLYYEIDAAGDQVITLKANGGTVATLVGGGLHTGTVDVSGIVGYNVFYAVEVTANHGAFEVRLIQEQAGVDYPALASFADDTTPTALQWQALSTYASALSAALDSPVAVGAGYGRADAPVTWVGTINHRSRYLAYSFYLLAPYHIGDDGEAPWIDGYISVGGNTVLVRRNGKAGGSACDYEHSSEADAVWTGVVDLNACAPELVIGQDYRLVFGTYDSTVWDAVNVGRLFYLYETPAGDVLPGWTAFPTWSHGDYVTGAKVQAVKDNLEAMGSKIDLYRNPAARHPWEGVAGEAYMGFPGGVLFGVRKRRFLHYRSEGSSTITFRLRGRSQAVGLPDATDQWLALDMESIKGLYPGTRYNLNGVYYAIEDSEP